MMNLVTLAWFGEGVAIVLAPRIVPQGFLSAHANRPNLDQWRSTLVTLSRQKDVVP